MENWGINAERIHRIFFPAIEVKLLDYMPRRQSGADLCFVGRVVREKGLHILVKALHKITMIRIRTLIVGPVEEKYYKKLEKLIFRLSLDRHIEFKGPVYNDDKHDLIAGSKLFVLPSLKEYTPNVILESQALGVPVIATRVGAIPEMILDRDTGLLVEPGNVDQLADAIEALLADEELRKRMSVRAREWAKNFTLDRAVTELERVYKSLEE